MGRKVTLLDSKYEPIYPHSLYDAIGELDSSGNFTPVLKSASKRDENYFVHEVVKKGSGNVVTGIESSNGKLTYTLGNVDVKETDLSNYYTKSQTDSAIKAKADQLENSLEGLKTELNERITQITGGGSGVTVDELQKLIVQGDNITISKDGGKLKISGVKTSESVEPTYGSEKNKPSNIYKFGTDKNGFVSGLVAVSGDDLVTLINKSGKKIETTIINGNIGGDTTWIASSNSLKPKTDTENLIISTQGTIKAAKGFYEESDERLKNITAELDNNYFINSLDNIKLIKFMYKSDEKKEEHIGVIAQEVEEYFPELVKEIQGEDGNFYKHVDYAKLSVVSLCAIKALREEVKKLNFRLDTLLA